MGSILRGLGFWARCLTGWGAVKAIESLFTETMGPEPWVILILMQLSFLVMGTFLDETTAMLVNRGPRSMCRWLGALGFDLVWYGGAYRFHLPDRLLTALRPITCSECAPGPARDHDSRHFRSSSPLFGVMVRRSRRHDLSADRALLPGTIVLRENKHYQTQVVRATGRFKPNPKQGV